ncbi:PilW family protein [Sedimenticola sp.]|uniref:PilW family protein n=1 Tax=Sedimenticola sp. TaxID=1940285 RepID=UPI003D1400D3
MISGRQTQTGLSLVELMVALAISGTLMAGVMQVFSGSKQVDRLAMATARIQENGRFAVDILNEELQHIGYQGCFNPNTPISSEWILANEYNIESGGVRDLTNNTVKGLNDFAVGVTQIDLNNGVAIDGANPLPNTDALFVARASQSANVLEADMAGVEGALNVATNPAGHAVNDMLLITNCKTASIFRVSDLSTSAPRMLSHAQGSLSKQNVSASFHVAYEKGSNLHRLVYNTYFIRNNAQGIPSLYRDNAYEGLAELIRGVENMQVLYGHYDSRGTSLTSDDRVRWLDADDVDSDEWREVMAVRLAILVRDEENVLPSTGPSGFDLLGTTVAPAATDQRLRRVFTTTAKIRNRRGEVNF